MKTIPIKYKQALLESQNYLGSIASLASKYNCERHTLTKYINQKLDISKCDYENETHCFLLDDNERLAIQLYIENNVSIEEIVKQTKVSSSTLDRWVRKFNIQPRGCHRHYNFNQSIFNTIDTEEKAYWLGFITADGYVNESRHFLNIKLQAGDEAHLYKFKQFLGCIEIPIKDDIGGSGQIVKSITVNSRTLVNDLINLGVRQGKSGNEHICNKVPDNLIPHYIRGLIDGDGCIQHGSHPTVELVGSLEIVSFLKQYIHEHIYPLKSTASYIYKHGIIYKASFNALDCVLLCYKHFYGNAKIYLDRKYEQILKFNQNYGRG